MSVSRPSDGSVTITKPAFDNDPTRDLSTRMVEQQWRDAADDKLDKRFPDSLNLESSRVTDS